MRILKSLMVLSGIAFLGGCGTIMSGQSQEITLLTPGTQDARCNLDNGNNYVAYTGQKITIMRSNHDLKVDCYASGNRHNTITVSPHGNKWAAGDVATGVAPGVGYDFFGGGLFEYPDVITVDFAGNMPQGFGLPHYHDADAISPYDQPIEEYGPTVAKKAGDSNYLVRGAPKRGPVMDSNPFATPPASSGTTGSYVGGTMTPLPQGSNAETLTRSMNPHVFNQ